MNGTVAKQLRRTAGITDINKTRQDVTYMLHPTSSFRFTRRIKDESLKRYKRAKQMYYDRDMRGYLT